MFFFFILSTSWLSLFFFSSRRRHTRCYRDWSSDVCSSDLESAQRAGETAAVLVTDVHRRRGTLALDEEPTLSLEVALERAVKVQMVLAEVREDERGEARALEASELRTVRRRLHHAAQVALGKHLAERPLKVDRLRRRPIGSPPLGTNPSLDGGHERRAKSRVLQHGVEEIGGGRLSVRTCDPGDRQIARRVVEELGRGASHGLPGIANHDLGYGDVQRTLEDQRDRPACDGVRGEVVPIGPKPGDAEEERAGPDVTGVVGQVANVRRSAAPHVRRSERRNEPLQLHVGRVYQGPLAGSRPGNRHRSAPNAALLSNGHWLRDRRNVTLAAGRKMVAPGVSPRRHSLAPQSAARPEAPRDTAGRTSQSARRPARPRLLPRSPPAARPP